MKKRIQKQQAVVLFLTLGFSKEGIATLLYPL